MTTTLSNMTAKKKPEPSVEEVAAREVVRLAKEQDAHALPRPDQADGDQKNPADKQPDGTIGLHPSTVRRPPSNAGPA